MIIPQEVRTIFHMHKLPYPNLICDVSAEHEHYMVLRIYRDNIHEFSDDQMVGIFLWVNSVMDDIRRIIPCYLEISDYVPF